MAIVKNLTARRPLSVWGTKLKPGEAGEVKASEAKIRQHPFAREGWIDVMATGDKTAGGSGSNGGAPSAKDLVAQIEEMGAEDADQLEQLMDDSRTTVSNAAQKRYEEVMDAQGQAGGDGEGDPGAGDDPAAAEGS